MDWRALDRPQQFAPMCRRCGWCGPLRDTHLEDAGPHIKATCPECDTYLCFAKKRKDAMAHTNGPKNSNWVSARSKPTW